MSKKQLYSFVPATRFLTYTVRLRCETSYATIYAGRELEKKTTSWKTDEEFSFLF